MAQHPSRAAPPVLDGKTPQGSMVMNTEKELDQARADFMRGYFGQPWDHRLSDDEWREVGKQAKQSESASLL